MFTRDFYHITSMLVEWHSGRTMVFDQQTFPVLRSTCSWWATTYVGKLSTVGQPTSLSQPSSFRGRHMCSRLQSDVRNLSLGRCHLVNTYEVKAGIGVIAGNTVWSMPECLECEVLQKVCYINTFTFYLYLTEILYRDENYITEITVLSTSQYSVMM